MVILLMPYLLAVVESNQAALGACACTAIILQFWFVPVLTFIAFDHDGNTACLSSLCHKIQ